MHISPATETIISRQSDEDEDHEGPQLNSTSQSTGYATAASESYAKNSGVMSQRLEQKSYTSSAYSTLHSNHYGDERHQYVDGQQHHYGDDYDDTSHQEMDDGTYDGRGLYIMSSSQVLSCKIHQVFS